MEANPEVKARATHEVMDHNNDDAIAFQGTGQECADFMYEHKGYGYCTRSIFNV